MYEQSFRDNREMSALTDYFKGETFSYYEIAKEVAKLHLMFKEAGIAKGDKIALIGRNNTRWCISYIATITYGAIIVPILQDFNPNDVINIINHSESKLLFLGDNFWDDIEGDQIPAINAVFSLTDFHVIYEKSGDKLTEYMKNIMPIHEALASMILSIQRLQTTRCVCSTTHRVRLVRRRALC